MWFGDIQQQQFQILDLRFDRKEDLSLNRFFLADLRFEI